jgi:hypothetical protein
MSLFTEETFLLTLILIIVFYTVCCKVIPGTDFVVLWVATVGYDMSILITSHALCDPCRTYKAYAGLNLFFMY